MTELVFDDDFLELYGDYIYIPEKTVFWRGYDIHYSAVSDRPAYYGSRSIANEYAKRNGHVLGSFMTTRRLKLLDIRFMRVLLRNLFQDVLTVENITKNKYIKKTNVNDGTKAILSTSLSFGICSLKKQIEMLKEFLSVDNDERISEMEKYYKADSMIEQEGVRIGDTTIDRYTMSFLKHLFQDFVDGFISPRLSTPYHIEKQGTINPEMIIFNPKKAGIIQVKVYKQLPQIHIDEIITGKKPFITKENHNKYKKHVGAYIEHPLATFERELNEGNKKALKIYKDASTIGDVWRRKYFKYFLLEPPAPCTRGSIFENCSYIAPEEKDNTLSIMEDSFGQISKPCITPSVMHPRI